MYFKCHVGKEPFFTEGKAYEIEGEDSYAYLITADDGNPHHLTKEPDHAGDSYKTFMTLEEGISVGTVSDIYSKSN
jgi:hypothetical protein